MTEQIQTAAPYAPTTVRPSPEALPLLDTVGLRADRERLRRARAAYEAKLSRLRLYSYCLTLTSCVFALMAFMYLTQGAADGDASFVWLGVAFVAATVTALWLAIRITHVAEPSTS